MTFGAFDLTGYEIQNFLLVEDNTYYLQNKIIDNIIKVAKMFSCNLFID